jgi:hypothetical protein
MDKLRAIDLIDWLRAREREAAQAALGLDSECDTAAVAATLAYCEARQAVAQLVDLVLASGGIRTGIGEVRTENGRRVTRVAERRTR